MVGKIPLQVSKFELTVLAFFDCIHPHGHCLLQEFFHEYAACKSDMVNIIPFRKLISVVAENSVPKDWVAEVKGLFPETHCSHKRSHLSLLNGDVLDLVSLGGISSGATFEIFRLVSLGPANSPSYRSLARLSIPV